MIGRLHRQIERIETTEIMRLSSGCCSLLPAISARSWFSPCTS